MSKTSVIPRNPTLGNNRGGERVLSAVVDLHAPSIPRGRDILKVILFFSETAGYPKVLWVVWDFYPFSQFQI